MFWPSELSYYCLGGFVISLLERSLLSAKTLQLSDCLGAVVLLYHTLALTVGRDMREMFYEGIITEKNSKYGRVEKTLRSLAERLLCCLALDLFLSFPS